MQYKDIMTHPYLVTRQALEMNLAACVRASATSRVPTLVSLLN
jgi:hypothetical protein